MRAVVIREGDLVLEERPDPTPGPGEVVVAVRAAGVNAADLLQRRGLYPAPAGAPADVPGLEFAGVVEGLGAGVDPAWRGRRVAGLTGGGAQATSLVAPVELLVEVPDSITWAEAGALMEGAATVHDALVTQGRLSPGDHVLISGAAGGVGTLAVQVAALLGGTVTAVTRDGAHGADLRDLGARDVVPLEAVGGLAPVDLLLELVGAAHFEIAQRVLAPGARVVVIGVGAGARAEIDLLGVMARRVVLTGSTLRARSREEKAAVTAALWRDLAAPLGSGELRVPLAGAIPLEEAVRAYELFARRGRLGKVVLVVEP